MADRMAAARAAKARKRMERENGAVEVNTRSGEIDPGIDPSDLHIDSEAGLSSSRKSAVADARRATRQARNLEREPIRRPLRDEMRAPNGRLMVRGRDGEMLTRKRSNTSDPFHIDQREIPDGWSYQWIAKSVLGNSSADVISTTSFFENGWRPVPASRHPGQFMPAGYTGNIERDGQMLVERPLQLTQEAREEEIATAKNLIRTQNEQFMPRLPNARAGQRGTNLQARRTIEPMPQDIDRPSYDLSPE
jgi:hypothetical protein